MLCMLLLMRKLVARRGVIVIVLFTVLARFVFCLSGIVLSVILSVTVFRVITNTWLVMRYRTCFPDRHTRTTIAVIAI
jgi:hypothetical protein